jgi:tetratricopeptide (TPR) repeat protein
MTKWILMILTLLSTVAPSQSIPLAPAQPGGLDPISETDKRVRALQEQVKKSPNNYAGFDRLGSALFQKARETGDISYYDLAEQALQMALNLAPHDFRASDPFVHLALVYMGEHRFNEALNYSQKAIATGSGSLDAFAIEGDAYTDMGEYDEAASAYNTLQALGGTFSSSLKLAYMINSRMAYLRFLHGDTEEAIRLMRGAIDAGRQANIPQENLAWLYFELGERYFQAGDLENAAVAYEAGISADSGHYRSLAGLAKVRASQGRLAESIQLYQRSIAIIPFPAYVAELGDVYRKSGQPKEAQEEFDLVEYIGHLSKLNQVLANRELAMFYADHAIKLPEALEFAQRELDVRHDIYTWDTLAWVQYKNGHFREASDAMDKALRLQTKDPLILFHAGMISHSLGKDDIAGDFLRRALETNPQFHILDSEIACGTLQAIRESAQGRMESNNAHR